MWLRRIFPNLDSGTLEEVPQLSPEELRERLATSRVKLLDVREPFEVRVCCIAGAIHIPLRQLLGGETSELHPEDEIVVYCHHGIRSQQAALFLLNRGFGRVANLAGGIDAWSLVVDRSVRRY